MLNFELNNCNDDPCNGLDCSDTLMCSLNKQPVSNANGCVKQQAFLTCDSSRVIH